MGGETGETAGAGCQGGGKAEGQEQPVGYEARAWQRSPNQRATQAHVELRIEQ